MNYAYNLRANNNLFRDNHGPHYYYENEISLQSFVNIHKPPIDYRLKVIYYPHFLF